MSGITPVSGAHGYGVPEADGTEPATHSVDPLAELAALMVENDFLRQEIDDQNLRAHREAQQRALREEVAAMHEAADAIAREAWIRGGVAAVGGAAKCTGSLGQIGDTPESPRDGWDTALVAGDELGKLAEPLGALLGGTAKAEADADAREARGEAELAGSRADEAREHRNRVSRHTDSVLGLVEGTLESEQRTNMAILGNF